MSFPRAHRLAVRRVLRSATALAGAAAMALMAAACTSSSSTSSSKQPDGANFVGGDGSITVVKADRRQPAPELSGKTVDGGHASLSAYRGKVVVINIWGSWCAPCRAEAPNLVKVAKADVAKGVQFLGINTRDPGIANPARFDQRYGIPYPSLFDPYGKLILKFPRGNVNPQTLPATLVIDRHGRIAARALKALSEDELNELIDPIAAEK